MTRTATLALLLGLLGFSAVVGAAERGHFGFGLRTEFDGSFWNPVLASASISLLVPNSPAAKSGITLGDVVVEIDGLPVPGAKGAHLKKLEAVLEKKAAVGDRMHLKLRRNNGQDYSIVLIAEPREQ